MRTRAIEKASQKQKALCQTCGSRPWQAITTIGRVHRCLNCWFRHYFAKELSV